MSNFQVKQAEATPSDGMEKVLSSLQFAVTGCIYKSIFESFDTKISKKQFTSEECAMSNAFASCMCIFPKLPI